MPCDTFMAFPAFFTVDSDAAAAAATDDDDDATPAYHTMHNYGIVFSSLFFAALLWLFPYFPYSTTMILQL